MSRKRKPRRPRHIASQESKAAEALTVFWMLTLLATVVAEFAALVSRLVVVLIQPLEPMVMLSSVLLLVATITGLLCLALIPAVLHLRRVPPPAAITKFAIIVGALPATTILLMWAFAR